jgi:prevent-host-death family protein
MGKHSIVEAKNKLSELIARAAKGEEIVITSHGRVVARLVAEPPAPRVMTDADWDWLAKRRAGRGRPKEDAGTFVSRMRDEDWERF